MRRALTTAVVAVLVVAGVVPAHAGESVEVVAWNTPHRLGPHAAGVAQLARTGADVIAVQEVTDRDPERMTPPGWSSYRPARARHNAVLWDRATVERVRCGALRVSNARTGPRVRYAVWCHFRTAAGPMRVASVHLPAFYTRSDRNRREYDAQEPRLARWLERGRWRVMAGDYNGRIPGRRTPNLADAARWSRPVPSGPSGQRIDYVGASRAGPWRVSSTVAGPYLTSDHRPVRVTLTRP